VLSEVRQAAVAQAFEALADLAPTLRERELRVLLTLSKALINSEHKSGHMSLNALTAATQMAKSNVRLAIASLRERKIVAARAGTATEAAGYGLTFLRVRQIPERGVPIVGTPPHPELWKKVCLA
jgi:DNA-binding transcriptional ArsR family regulator